MKLYKVYLSKAVYILLRHRYISEFLVNLAAPWDSPREEGQSPDTSPTLGCQNQDFKPLHQFSKSCFKCIISSGNHDKDDGSSVSKWPTCPTLNFTGRKVQSVISTGQLKSVCCQLIQSRLVGKKD